MSNTQQDSAGHAIAVGDIVTVQFTVVGIGTGGGNNLALATVINGPSGAPTPVTINANQTVWVS